MDQNSEKGKKINKIILVGFIIFVIVGLIILVILRQIEKNAYQTSIPTTPASLIQMEQISEFIHGDYRIINGCKTPSSDGYYVGAKIIKNEEIQGVGVWYVFGPDYSPRSVLRVNETGEIATPNLSLASTTEFDYSMKDEEAIAVYTCAENN